LSDTPSSTSAVVITTAINTSSPDLLSLLEHHILNLHRMALNFVGDRAPMDNPGHFC
jgi:hypothetical protein